MQNSHLRARSLPLNVGFTQINYSTFYSFLSLRCACHSPAPSWALKSVKDLIYDTMVFREWLFTVWNGEKVNWIRSDYTKTQSRHKQTRLDRQLKFWYILKLFTIMGIVSLYFICTLSISLTLGCCALFSCTFSRPLNALSATGSESLSYFWHSCKSNISPATGSIYILQLRLHLLNCITLKTISLPRKYEKDIVYF